MPLSEPVLRRETTTERNPTSKARSLAGVKFTKSDVEARQHDAVIMKATRVASSRMFRESARLELAVMEQQDRLDAVKVQMEERKIQQQDRLDALKAEQEHARRVRNEKRKLIQLKLSLLRKKSADKRNRLEREEESDSSEAVIEHVKLPKEQPGDSIHRLAVGATTPILDRTSNQTGFETMAESMAHVQQNVLTQRLAVASQPQKLEIPVFSGVADGHGAKDRTERKVCKICEGRPLACLHKPTENQINPPEEAASKYTNVCAPQDQDEQEHCMIVPDWVRCKDDQRNVGFVSDELCEQLGVQGTDTTLKLTTMHTTANVRSMKASGLQVLDFNRENEIDLPPCFSRESIPASRTQIPRSEGLKEWPHLEPVAHELMPYNRSVKVSLLIGNNCPRAIRPLEVIAGGEDDPYAIKTALGWGVVGNVCQTSVQEDGVQICNRISAIEMQPEFAYESKAKEIMDTEKGIQFPKDGYKDSSADGELYSVEEMEFKEILESGARRCDKGHYEMPLPPKSAKPNLSFNKPLPLKRWKQLPGRLRKNPKFGGDYRAFMDDVIQNHAPRVPRAVTALSEVDANAARPGHQRCSHREGDCRRPVASSKGSRSFPSQDGRVRKVKLLMTDGALDSNGKRLKKPCYLDRPVHKLVLLLTVEA
ncbi:uncharacterized protein LOC115922739 [Strongylocentrotus purpuratus]|uniref:Uncharacterized protein n=1 Tax=Strongylocentrotus purpuratus TaxID=7668 RepID=A0A7M7NN70_STRPU|nr:uncharacterized protein LOC115922738 [Strongylocentrotus purpuratus]XP_030838115.1 uncharacterized protein LOC115922739 [Strongylocentrotus purpuratus]